MLLHEFGDFGDLTGNIDFWVDIDRMDENIAIILMEGLESLETVRIEDPILGMEVPTRPLHPGCDGSLELNSNDLLLGDHLSIH